MIDLDKLENMLSIGYLAEIEAEQDPCSLNIREQWMFDTLTLLYRFAHSRNGRCQHADWLRQTKFLEDSVLIAYADAYKRKVAGGKKYGEESYLIKDNLKEAEEELLDLINYATFEIIKLKKLKEKIDKAKKI